VVPKIALRSTPQDLVSDMVRLFLPPRTFGGPLTWWSICGESFLSLTERLPAEILVVEGWVGRDGVRAAAAEFEEGGYQYVIATGGLSVASGWSEGGWSYAEGAHHELLRSGVPEDRIIVAPSGDAQSQRTYESAVAVRRALAARGIHPKALNVFTWGPHGRRSRLVFAKVSGMEVGVIGWTPSGDQAVPWWRSSDRAKDLLVETAGYVYEVLLDSGRGFSSLGNGAPKVAQQLSLGRNTAKVAAASCCDRATRPQGLAE
jgi:DUF218 domain-containing protein